MRVQDDDGPVVSEAAVGRIAPSRRSNHFDETENMRIKRIAIRFCTVFGVMTVLGVLIGAFAFGVLGPPPRLHGVLLTKSCTLPAKRVMLSSSNGTTAGELLVPWPHHVFVPPFTGSVESMPRYFLAPTVDIHLLTEGVPMDVDMIALMANRIYLHCNTLNSLVDSGRTSHARTPGNTLSGEGVVIVSNIILSLAVKFGNGTPFAPGSPWFTTGAFHASPLPQFPQFEEYRLVVSSSPDLPATATARLLKACRAAVGVDVSHTHGRWLSGVTDSPAVTITSSSVWGIMR